MSREGIRALQDEMAQADARRIDALEAEGSRLRAALVDIDRMRFCLPGGSYQTEFHKGWRAAVRYCADIAARALEKRHD